MSASIHITFKCTHTRTPIVLTLMYEKKKKNHVESTHTYEKKKKKKRRRKKEEEKKKKWDCTFTETKIVPLGGEKFALTIHIKKKSNCQEMVEWKNWQGSAPRIIFFTIFPWSIFKNSTWFIHSIVSSCFWSCQMCKNINLNMVENFGKFTVRDIFCIA